MICVYVLISTKDGKRYIGSTNDLDRRFKEHNNGLVFSTKNRRPLVLKYYQEFESLIEARVFESKYKKSRGMFDRAIKNQILKIHGD
ncbi:MAG TPA: GIY-YIG nuclease family protein [Alphaproteobacteria bacterium]|jgi:putative endonuclease|nr:GIY-YIG nuclease family protein [Alphaproteobacteria bacterium]